MYYERLVDSVIERKLRSSGAVLESDEPSPGFLVVLTASGPRYRREDGVFVTPINKLRD